MAITLLRVRAEPTALSKPVEEVKLMTRGRSALSTLLYSLRRLGPRKLAFYSISIGCVVMGLAGLLLASVEILYRVLWLLMWLVVAYAFKVLAS
jgi:hypothetical protein